MFCLMIIACESDVNSLNDKDSDKLELREGDIMDKKECFTLAFPLEIMLPNKDVIEVTDEEEFYSFLKKWYKNNPKDKEKPGLNYPVEVLFKDDISKKINSEKEMGMLKDYCDKKGYDYKEACLELAYPVSYTMPDGTTVTGANQEEVKTALKSWYEANPDSKEKYELDYPVDVILKDGSTITVDSEEEMIALKKDC